MTMLSCKCPQVDYNCATETALRCKTGPDCYGPSVTLYISLAAHQTEKCTKIDLSQLLSYLLASHTFPSAVSLALGCYILAPAIHNSADPNSRGNEMASAASNESASAVGVAVGYLYLWCQLSRILQTLVCEGTAWHP